MTEQAIKDTLKAFEKAFEGFLKRRKKVYEVVFFDM